MRFSVLLLAAAVAAAALVAPAQAQGPRGVYRRALCENINLCSSIICTLRPYGLDQDVCESQCTAICRYQDFHLSERPASTTPLVSSTSDAGELCATGIRPSATSTGCKAGSSVNNLCSSGTADGSAWCWCSCGDFCGGGDCEIITTVPPSEWEAATR